MSGFPISTVVLTTGLVLILIGIWGMLTHRNILRIIIGFSLIGTGTHIVMVAIGYVTNGTAPIIDRALSVADAPSRAVDPIPSALVVTAIVIGLAVTAVMLAYAIRLYEVQEDAVDRRLHGVEMVADLLHPLNIFIIGLGGGFLIPLLYRLGQLWLSVIFILALAGMTLIAAVCPVRGGKRRATDRHSDRQARPRPTRSICVSDLPRPSSPSASTWSRCSARYYFVRAKYAVMLLYLLLVMGIQGMVMTRDLFNLFVFLEIVSIATYGLLSLQDTPAALSATFKYLMATVLASTFFLIGTVLLYAVTGMLNIDDLISNRPRSSGRSASPR